MSLETASHQTLLRSRLLQVMDALERAGGTPIAARDLHAFAYFANVLSPIWDVEPLEGAVLKEHDGPYFPSFQRDIDDCIGKGLIRVESFESIIGPDGTGRLEASFRLSVDLARPLVGKISALPDERNVGEFLLELAFAFLEIKPSRRDDAAIADAAWSDPSIPEDRVVDFAEWVVSTHENPSWNVAQRFQDFAPTGITFGRAEKLVMYMRLLKRRAHG